MGTARVHAKRQARYRALLESGKTINVVFEVTGIPKWKADSLLQLMLEHPRFNPIVWHVPYIGERGSARDREEQEQCKEHFATLGAKLVCYDTLKDFPADEKPDIVFPNEP